MDRTEMERTEIDELLLESRAKFILEDKKHELIMRINNWLDDMIENGDKYVMENRENILNYYNDKYLKSLLVEFLEGVFVKPKVIKPRRICISRTSAINYVLSKIKENGYPSFTVSQEFEEKNESNDYIEDEYEI